MGTAVDHVADVVKIAGDFCVFNHMLAVTESGKNIARNLADSCNVGKAVLGKAESGKRFIGFSDVGFDGFVVSDGFVKAHTFFSVFLR